MSDNPSEMREIIHAPWRRPNVLLWLYMLPQMALLFLNLRSYHLVSGEMSPEQHGHASMIFGYACALILIQCGLWMLTRGREWLLRWTLAIPLLLAHIGYLWMFVAWMDDLIPRTVAWWMLPPERVLYHQFALIMPAVFHSALVLSCFPTRLTARRDVLRSALILFAVPGVWYVVAHVAFRIRRDLFDVPEVVVFLLLTFSTILLTGALLRLLASGWNAIRRGGAHGQLILITLVGLVGPLGGLWLNAIIPFPVDFQSLAVYVLASLNGFVLLLPGSGATRWHRMIWVLQCAAFPFTLYFFLVFLPFLPLGLLAVIAAGAGFLMLVPTALCLIHLSLLREGWKNAGRFWRIAAALSLLILPGFFVVRAWQDRAALHGALDYLYEPSSGAETFDGDVDAVGRSLRNLRDFKAGLQLPFISDYYNQVVFGGLAMPDSRIQDMHRAFFGRDLEPPDESRLSNPLTGRTRVGRFAQIRTPPELPHNVAISALRSDETTQGDVRRLLLTLNLTNRGAGGSEYVAPITLPPGTWVSGFWLKIGDERVPGRLFEKKTALWVYEMIRDQSRRDPGLLFYRGPQKLELRVFPFAENETRTVEIEVLFPKGIGAPITIDTSKVAVLADREAHPVATVTDASGQRLWLVSPEAWKDHPAMPRSTYLHVLLDNRADAPTMSEIWPKIEAAARELGVDRCAISLANFEARAITTNLVSLVEAKNTLLTASVPARGGFCRDRALKHALRKWRQQQPDLAPVFLVISDATNQPAADPDLAWFASSWPGADGFTTLNNEGHLQEWDWAGRERTPAGQTSWTTLELGGQTHWIPVSETMPVLLLDAAGGVSGDHEIRDERYRQGATAWLKSFRRWAGSGGDVRDIVEASRAGGILVPAASYIVVENSAQWRFLEQSEKQKLGQNTALEFRDAPEPASWLLALGFLVWTVWRKARQTRLGSNRSICI